VAKEACRPDALSPCLLVCVCVMQVVALCGDVCILPGVAVCGAAEWAHPVPPPQGRTRLCHHLCTGTITYIYTIAEQSRVFFHIWRDMEGRCGVCPKIGLP
jgi:hypothetical protein